jgi:predicted amidohydrolase YtcJ
MDASMAASDGSPAVAVPGFADAHTHLLAASAGTPFPWEETSVADFHRSVARAGSTPMDVPEAPPPQPLPLMAERLRAGLAAAAAAGLVEITEMGMRNWWYFDALALLQRAGPLPLRVRVYLASGLADKAGPAEMAARTSSAGPWVSLDGVKFYADGWLGPRTCAMCHPFADHADDGLLFMDAGSLARRIEPFAEHRWRIATHAIGDRAVLAVLDAYELAWGGDLAAISAAAPRIEHASVQSGEIIARMAESGVVACIQPSFAVTDAHEVQQALAPGLRGAAYPWAAMISAGVRTLAGSDYPIEVIEPLVGLARLVRGHAERPGFHTGACAQQTSRLSLATALRLLTDATAGETILSADPRTTAAGIDHIEVRGTVPVPFQKAAA